MSRTVAISAGPNSPSHRRPWRWPCRISCLLATILCYAGCSSESSNKPVSGMVTFRGQRLEQGSIEFSPAEGQPTFSGGPIRDGRYFVPAEQGLAPGKYDVRISSTEGSAPEVDGAPGEIRVPFQERIPEQYNSQTTLTALVVEESENNFDFTIP